MTEGVDESENKGCNQNYPLEHVTCWFDYSLQINDGGTFEIL